VATGVVAAVAVATVEAVVCPDWTHHGRANMAAIAPQTTKDNFLFDVRPPSSRFPGRLLPVSAAERHPYRPPKGTDSC